MSFLNIWALLLIIPIVWLFRDIFRYEAKRSDSLESLVIVKRQSKLLLAVLILSIIALSRPVLLDTQESEKFAFEDYILAKIAPFLCKLRTFSLHDLKQQKKLLMKFSQKIYMIDLPFLPLLQILF